MVSAHVTPFCISAPTTRGPLCVDDVWKSCHSAPSAGAARRQPVCRPAVSQCCHWCARARLTPPRKRPPPHLPPLPPPFLLPHHEHVRATQQQKKKKGCPLVCLSVENIVTSSALSLSLTSLFVCWLFCVIVVLTSVGVCISVL